MQRASKAATRRIDQLTLDTAFGDADAKAGEEFAEQMARMRTAVEVAHELAGIASPATFQKRLAYLLAVLYFCGGTKREGSRAFIRTLCERTRNTRRTLDRLLARARELDLVQSRRGPRQTFNRLHTRWIDELVAQKRAAASGASRVPSGASLPQTAPKVAHHPPASGAAHHQTVVRHPPKWRTDRDQAAYQEDLASRLPHSPPATSSAGLTWGELAELLDQDEEGVERVLRQTLSRFACERVLRLRRAGERIPDAYLSPLLEACRDAGGVW